jgi:membrane protease YdiL (CAAX protease family)
MYSFLSKTYRRLFRFIRKPDDQSSADVRFSSKLRTLLALFLLNATLVCIWMFVVSFLGIDNLENANANLLEMPFGKMLLIGVITIPLLEEILFRFPMKYERNYLLHLLIAAVGLFAPAKHRSAILANARSLWSRFFGLFFYGMTLVFAFAHLNNYVDAEKLLIWSPFLIFTQFLTGLVLGYIRIRFGLLWSWGYHALFNFVLLSVASM